MKLSDREWKEFFIAGEDGVFDISSTSSGIDKNKILTTNDVPYTPYITRSEDNNGINLFIAKEQSKKYKLDEANVITIGLDTQTVFYQSHEFYTGQNIQVLRHKNLNKANAIFLIPLIKVQMEKFNWGGNGATLGRLFRTKLMLPINNSGEIDWEYMETYSNSIIKTKWNKYKTHAESILQHLNFRNIKKLEEKIWAEFEIESILNISSGKRLTKADMKSGNKPFIGSTDSNNGITAFVSNTNASEDFNVLGVNYNGSVVENFYHPYKAIFSDDVKRLSLKNTEGNEFLYLFIKNLILKQKSKYQYAYKFNEKRLKRQKILLPVNKDDEPDYEYLEQYIINLKYKKIKQYLDFLIKEK